MSLTKQALFTVISLVLGLATIGCQVNRDYQKLFDAAVQEKREQRDHLEHEIAQFGRPIRSFLFSQVSSGNSEREQVACEILIDQPDRFIGFDFANFMANCRKDDQCFRLIAEEAFRAEPSNYSKLLAVYLQRSSCNSHHAEMLVSVGFGEVVMALRRGEYRREALLRLQRFTGLKSWNDHQRKMLTTDQLKTLKAEINAARKTAG